jgi:hypothetical protein
VQALEALADREPEEVMLLHVVDKPALQALAGKNPAGERRILAAMEKAGGILLRDAARSARVALGQAATAPRTTIRTIMAQGSLAKTIAREARRLRADLTHIAGAEIEPSITVNPANPRNIVATWQQDLGTAASSDLIGTSYDGGKTWTRVTIPQPCPPASRV